MKAHRRGGLSGSGAGSERLRERALVRRLGPVAIAVGLTLVLVLGAALSAQAATRRPADRSGWVGVRSGLIVGTTIGGGTLDIQTETLMAPSFGVGASYRFRRIDLGGLVEALGGTTFIFDGQRRRLGGQARGVATLRWRSLDQHWGGLYLGLGVGWIGVRLPDTFRDAVVEVEGSGLSRGDVGQTAMGIVGSFSLGMVFYPTERLIVHIELEGIGAAARLSLADDFTGVTLTRSVINAGVSWRM